MLHSLRQPSIYCPRQFDAYRLSVRIRREIKDAAIQVFGFTIPDNRRQRFPLAKKSGKFTFNGFANRVSAGGLEAMQREFLDV
jgi:hypothetical protein